MSKKKQTRSTRRRHATKAATTPRSKPSERNAEHPGADADQPEYTFLGVGEGGFVSPAEGKPLRERWRKRQAREKAEREQYESNRPSLSSIKTAVVELLGTREEHLRSRADRVDTSSEQGQAERDSMLVDCDVEEYGESVRLTPLHGACFAEVTEQLKARWTGIPDTEVQHALDDLIRECKVVETSDRKLLAMPKADRPIYRLAPLNRLAPQEVGEPGTGFTGSGGTPTKAGDANASTRNSGAFSWAPPSGYLSVKDIEYGDRFAKNGKRPPRTTIQTWEKRSQREVVEWNADNPVDIEPWREGDEVLKVVKSPDTQTVHYPEAWVVHQWNQWSPRTNRRQT